LFKQFSKQNISFRGHCEDFDSKKQDNFLETVKLIAKYNPVMNKHLSDMQVSERLQICYKANQGL